MTSSTASHDPFFQDIVDLHLESRPLDWVMWAFPWGETGTPLEHEEGPDTWQVDVLMDIQRCIEGYEAEAASIEGVAAAADIKGVTGESGEQGGASRTGGVPRDVYIPPTSTPQISTPTPQNISKIINRAIDDAIQIAVSSGHGIGKTALVAWIIMWFIQTRINPAIVVTANTENQLSNKTWRELAKWHKLCLMSHLYEWTATKYYLKGSKDTWFASAIPWSENNSEAFAGTHEDHVLLIFDEASAIADIIWEVAEGAMTTEGSMWIAFGNPTKNTGRFFQCFNRLKHRWITHRIDSRTAKKTNKKKLQEWVDDNGEDSDFVRVRIRGLHPRAGSNQLIPSDTVTRARNNVTEPLVDLPKVMGVDIAREGDDQSVIIVRQGPKVLGIQRYRIPNLMQLSSIISEEINRIKPDAVFIDAIGMGAGVVDRLRQLNHSVIGVKVGEKARKDDSYANCRAELWIKMRDWLRDTDADIPDDQELEDDLTNPEYFYDNKERIQLEAKKDMKKRGLSSPDGGDALALTFYPLVVSSRKPVRSIKTIKRWQNWRV